jgi:hypothetical protein
MKETETFEHKDSSLAKPKTILQRSLESGVSGAVAMSMNIATLMWLRTTISLRCEYANRISDAISSRRYNAFL